MSDDKIVGKGRVGDFVHANQVMAKDVGHKNVSKLWYDKTMSYEQLIEKLEIERRKQKDIVKTFKHADIICVDNDVNIKIGDELFKPTPYALKQFATHCYVPHTVINDLCFDKMKPNSERAAFKRDNGDRNLLVQYFKNGMRRVDKDKIFRFRTYTDGTLRAVLTKDYQIIQNAWYLEQLQTLLPDGRVSHWRGNADEFYGNILMPDSIREDNDSDYGGMISGGNSELGNRCFVQTPSLFRAICMNGCIWDQTKGYTLRYVHKKSHINLPYLADQIKDNIHKQIPLIPTIIAKFMETRQLKMEKTDKIQYLVCQLGIDFKLQDGGPEKGHGYKILEGWKEEKENKNLFGLINSVTRAGQRLNKEEWYQFDEVGGSLMNYTADKWNTFRKKAASLDEETVNEFYGVYA